MSSSSSSLVSWSFPLSEAPEGHTMRVWGQTKNENRVVFQVVLGSKLWEYSKRTVEYSTVSHKSGTCRLVKTKPIRNHHFVPSSSSDMSSSSSSSVSGSFLLSEAPEGHTTRVGANENEHRVVFQVVLGSNSGNIADKRTIQYSTDSQKSGNVLLITH